MSTFMVVPAFDTIARQYDTLWTKSAIGRRQRESVWRHLDPLIRTNHHILDLGCGTGEDAVHLRHLGARVYAIDVSGEMVRIARSRGVDARQVPIGFLNRVDGSFDGVLSNFGVINCLERLDRMAFELARLIRPDGFLALCFMGRLCAWETCHFLKRRQFEKAFRRWTGKDARSGIGVQVRYWSAREIVNIFRGCFRITANTGIGLFVPPSYIRSLAIARIEQLAQLDRQLAHWPLLRTLADHRLLIFRRL